MSENKYPSIHRQRASPNAKAIKIKDPKKSSIFNSDTNSSDYSSPKRKKQRFLENLKQHNKLPDTFKDATSSSGTWNYIPTSDSEDSDGLDDLLINTNGIVSENQNSSSRPKTEAKDLAESTELTPPRPQPLASTPRKTALPAKQDVLDTIFDQQVDLEEVKTRFESMNIPPVTNSKFELRHRTDKYLDSIPKFLKGTKPMSYFYDLAKESRMAAPHETMRQRDKYNIRWEIFYGGYYGLKRQMYVASVILDTYRDLITKTSSKNATVAFWGPEDFCKYVLANEIILRFIMEDYECSFSRAEEIIKETSEYGTSVTDSIDFDDDVTEETNTLELPEVVPKSKPEPTKLIKISDLFDDSDDD
ncbi:Restriction of telomere capping protein 4 [Yamadazyma tenuis]|uniref:Restriction of telomere capping protein 4 n=1 Tax=Candida tenuis (strain ATCC 10573 / BCRC 21748 / CBS 615 / JCM 9827 / NBRC 10315 / NRRL Y-1498 / VKM Y-70) TaxID=590646 RepID=G3BAJ8_CANTC|nr:uncharacterized protein CANTEDRAFT_94326 [Yamadazyma tenuis ATCC 10573]EGV61420.1 hypothetical protein CANTEDRAFT_94326 [Yamadazyma tenuis ATCC 10573]WEJ92639.1 Restriction of telomere capping protein 4 [Yamadazyma tenuis]